MFDVPTESDRRGFLTRATAGAAMMALATLPEWASAQAPAAQAQGIDSNTAWLRGMNQKKYKQFFETGTANNFIPLLHIVNYFGAWRATTGVRDRVPYARSSWTASLSGSHSSSSSSSAVQ